MILPHFERGVRAVDILLDERKAPTVRPIRLKVDCPLGERQSAGAVAYDSTHGRGPSGR